MMKRILAGLLALVALPAFANTCTIRQAGATDQTVYVEFIDETTGIPNSGLAFNSSGIDLEYVRAGAAATDITEATQTAGGAHSDGGFVSVGHGRYRLDLPDAAVAAGVPEVVVQGVITGYIMLPCAVALSPPAAVVSVASGAIDAAAIATDAIGAAEIAADAIGAAEIAASAIAASEIATDAIGAAEIADGAIDNATFTCSAVSFAVLGIVDCGTAQSATSTTLVLRSALSIDDDALIGMTLVGCGSTQGYCQARSITDWVSSTDTATVETWTVTPSGTITYYLFGTAPSTGGGGLDAAGVRAAVGLSSANLDTQLAGIESGVDIDTIEGADASDTVRDAPWTAAARSITVLDEDSTTLDLNATAVGSVAGNVGGNVTGSVGSIATGGIAAASFASGAIDAAAIAANAIGASELAADAITSSEIADGAIDEGAVASDTITAAKVAADASTEVATAVTTAQGILTGTCDSGSTTTCVDDALTQADATQLEDRLICFSDGWCGLITTFTPASDTATTTKVAPSTRGSKTYTIFPATLE